MQKLTQEMLNQRKVYNLTLNQQFKVSNADCKSIVNMAVSENMKTPENFQCIICLHTLYEPKECKNCEIAHYCKLCIEQSTQ